MSAEPTEMERQAMVDRIQQALAEDHLEFHEIDDRLEKVYAASSTAELELAGDGLPELRQPPPPVAARHLAPASSNSIVGDVKIGGWLAVDQPINVFSGIGDVVVDLSSAAMPADGVTLALRTVVGDVKVIVPDGARVQMESTTVIGDRKSSLVQPIEGGPLVRVKSFSLVGDIKVYSLSEVPEGALRRLWRALRNER